MTVTSDMSTGDGGVIRIRPVNTACAPGLSPGQESYVAISRPAPTLVLGSTAEQICNVGQTASFTVTGLPPGATVSWSLSDPLSASLSSTSGSTVTVTKTLPVNTFITVNAVVTHCVFTYPLSKQIALGTGRTTVFFSDKQITCEAGGRPYFYGSAEGFTSATNYEWYAKDMSNSANAFVLKDFGSSTTDFPLTKGNRYYTIRVKAYTPCGVVQSLDSDGQIWVPDCNTVKQTLLLTPNPAVSDEVTVSLPGDLNVSRQSPVMLQRVLLCDLTGKVLRTIKPVGKTVVIHTGGLLPGLYIIKATDGNQWWVEKLLKP